MDWLSELGEMVECIEELGPEGASVAGLVEAFPDELRDICANRWALVLILKACDALENEERDFCRLY